MSTNKTILWNLKNKEAISTTILLDKVCVYNAKTMSILESVFHLQNIVERKYAQEKWKPNRGTMAGETEKGIVHGTSRTIFGDVMT